MHMHTHKVKYYLFVDKWTHDNTNNLKQVQAILKEFLLSQYQWNNELMEVVTLKVGTDITASVIHIPCEYSEPSYISRERDVAPW